MGSSITSPPPDYVTGLLCYIATAFIDSDRTTAIAMDGSSSSSAKPSDGQRPLPLSLLLHLDLIVHVLGFVHHVLVKLYPLDLCLVDTTVSIRVSSVSMFARKERHVPVC